MSLESFYGGRQGVSPVIKANFPSVQKMHEEFAKSNYTDVWYGELCLINPNNRNDKDYGKIFRRTYRHDNFNKAGYGKQGQEYYAEYVGKIAGPPGNIQIQFDSINNIQDATWGTDTDKNFVIYPIDSSSTSSNLNELNSSKSFPAELEGTSFETYLAKDEGKIKYTWLNHTDENSISTLHMGFKIPAPYFNWTVSPTEWNVTPSMTSTPSSNNHFYWNNKLNIPKGRPGNYISNLKINTATANITLPIWRETGSQTTAVSRGDKYWSYDYTSFDDPTKGKTYYMAPYKEMKDIIPAGAQYEFKFTDGSNIKVDVPVPKDFKLTDEGKIEYNFNGTTYYVNDGASADTVTPPPKQVNWVTDIKLLNDGSLVAFYNTPYFRPVVYQEGNTYKYKYKEQIFSLDNSFPTDGNYNIIVTPEGKFRDCVKGNTWNSDDLTDDADQFWLILSENVKQTWKPHEKITLRPGQTLTVSEALDILNDSEDIYAKGPSDIKKVNYIFYDTSSNAGYYYNGFKWEDIVSNAEVKMELDNTALQSIQFKSELININDDYWDDI